MNKCKILRLLITLYSNIHYTTMIVSPLIVYSTAYLNVFLDGLGQMSAGLDDSRCKYNFLWQNGNYPQQRNGKSIQGSNPQGQRLSYLQDYELQNKDSKISLQGTDIYCVCVCTCVCVFICVLFRGLRSKKRVCLIRQRE